MMKSMNALCNINEISNTMQSLSKEMMKMGLIEEMVSDAIDDVIEDVSDDEIDEETSKIIDEIMYDKMSGAHLPTSKIKQPTTNDENKLGLELDDLETGDELLKKINEMQH